MAGPTKRYDVSGQDLGGDGRPFPAGTILKLSRQDAERMGLEKPTKTARADDEAPPDAKPRPAQTRKRPAPKRAAPAAE